MSYREADMIDLTTLYGELVLPVIAFQAKQESGIRSERATRVIDAAKARGVRISWPPGSKDRKKRVRRHFRSPVGG